MLELTAPKLDDSDYLRQKLSQTMQGWVESVSKDGKRKNQVSMLVLKIQFDPGHPMIATTRMIEEYNLAICKLQLHGRVLDSQGHEDGEDISEFIHSLIAPVSMSQNDTPTFLEAWQSMLKEVSSVNAATAPESWVRMFNRLVLLSLKSIISDKNNSSQKMAWVTGQMTRIIDLIIRFNTDLDLDSLLNNLRFESQSRTMKLVVESITGMAKRIVLTIEKREEKNQDMNMYLAKSESIYYRTESVNAALVAMCFAMVDDDNEQDVSSMMDKIVGSLNNSIDTQSEIRRHEENMEYSPGVWRLRIKPSNKGREQVTNQTPLCKKRPRAFTTEATPLKKKKKHNVEKLPTLLPIRLFDDENQSQTDEDPNESKDNALN